MKLFVHLWNAEREKPGFYPRLIRSPQIFAEPRFLAEKFDRPLQRKKLLGFVHVHHEKTKRPPFEVLLVPRLKIQGVILTEETSNKEC